VFARGFGKADLENDVAATEATVYRLASISKPVTAVAVMMLRDQGRLDLDADVRKYVPAFPEKQWTVTPRLLLGHLAGVRHYKEGEAESTTHFATASDGLARFANDALLHEPGTKYLYSTYGFNLLGIAVEKVSGQTFASFVREKIAAPAGADSLRDDDVQAIIVHRAQGYVKQGAELRNAQLMDPSYKLGGGGLCCNAPDLVRFAMALMDGRLLRKESVAELWTAQKTSDGKATTYGLGFGVATRDGRRIVSHTGAQARVSTALCLLPDQGIAVVVLCNLERVPVGAMAQAIAAASAAEAR
jgi:CubicO group peptidase (beta-lactamase class C family)